MAFFSDKRFARNVLFWIAWMLCLTGRSQDTVLLKDVEVSVARSVFAEYGKKTERLDSATLSQFRFSSMADVLAFNSAVHIKSYGPGGLASTAFRGGSAEQTAILWNGFNLQNTMTGQNDLSLLPAVLFDNVSVEYGGSSSLWGSGAVGGSIHLNSRRNFGRGAGARLNAAGGSFGSANGSFDLVLSRSRFVSASTAYGSFSKNDFLYRAEDARFVRRQHAAYASKGFMQEFRFKPAARHLLDLNAWLSDNLREIPSFNTSMISRSYQADRAARFTANWAFFGSRLRSQTRAGVFMDQLRYDDSLAALYQHNHTTTIQLEHENYLKWGRHEAMLGLSGLKTTATSNSYRAAAGLSRISVLLGNRFHLAAGRLVCAVSLRAEYFSPSKLPFTGSIAAEYKIYKGLTAGINLGRVYRQPTLNELYWLPGGNPQLKAEQGYTAEGFITYRALRGRHAGSFTGAAFTRTIDNWILWAPGEGGNPRPMNLQQVWSRGTETTWQYHYSAGKFGLAASVRSSYVLSTVNTNMHEHNLSNGRQLIYTPRYAFNGNIRIVYAGTSLSFLGQYNGYRFITSDNARWLEPYTLASVRLNQSLRFRHASVQIFGACNNLFNVAYTVVVARPMPLRSFEFGISLNTNQKNK